MNDSIGIRRCRVPAFIAMLFGAIFTILLLPAYGQQEVDPTWYDPWASPNTAVVPASHLTAAAQSSQTPIATLRYQQTVRSVSPARDAGKPRGKNTQLDQSRQNTARKSDGTPSADNRQPGAPGRVVFKTKKAAAFLAGV